MRNKVIADIFVYVVSPVIVCNIVNNQKYDYIIVALLFAMFFYSFVTKKREYRINVTGLVFSFVYIGLYLLKQDIYIAFDKYIYDTYFYLIASITLIGLRFLNINMVSQLYNDILRAKGKTKVYIWNKLKKSTVAQELEKTLQIIIIHFMSVAFIKVYSIANYGINGYKTTLDLEFLATLLFIIAEVYMASRIMNIDSDLKRKKKNNKSSIITIKQIKTSSDDKIIYLNKYKKTNK
ncbi:hypothetical protein [Romboutsia lituseburensis]|uniref:hypothetical protein n=1 Tax=Romboutsia lituseburensis TaxID=1537 RepID=UPI00215A9E87|nr:hypothetical protein [Romboutsia lituseburensis]MCR8745071.1 hypothetical protein [Romboutsia lituseburensis]